MKGGKKEYMKECVLVVDDDRDIVESVASEKSMHHGP